MHAYGPNQRCNSDTVEHRVQFVCVSIGNFIVWQVPTSLSKGQRCPNDMSPVTTNPLSTGYLNRAAYLQEYELDKLIGPKDSLNR
jgi:hypothetical protein